MATTNLKSVLAVNENSPSVRSGDTLNLCKNNAFFGCKRLSQVGI